MSRAEFWGLSLKEWNCAVEGFLDFNCAAPDPLEDPIDPQELAAHNAAWAVEKQKHGWT
ncbi:hypothetical protein ABI_21880 [Asticcacaulis biprosthecium C19]|uniref:Uncharacterized protein n=1 Tax=Asticcacaulis biprosthecium C19 TaxID=715226 RepID=F4QGZ3_9CAUL|nr:hypothetical protein [Asticcacaulis biprosthecium]EGF93746.1 hypothetical protein ABI_21880 [Asticcacaulis biprosthecium C19]